MRASLKVSFSLFFLLAVALPARAQSLEEGLNLDEYKNVPKGVLMPKLAESDKSAEISDDDMAMTPEEINAAYLGGKYDVVFKHILPLAKNGYHPAEELLGVMYHKGQGVDQNAELAIFWLNKAAEANRPLAQHHLAVMNYAGEGIAADPVKALMWLDIAIMHYPEGPEKKRAIEDRDNIIKQLTRRDKDRAADMAHDWMDKRDEKAASEN